MQIRKVEPAVLLVSLLCCTVLAVVVVVVDLLLSARCEMLSGDAGAGTGAAAGGLF